MAESKLRTLSVDFAIQILNKLNKKKWLIQEDFIDLLAVSQSVPGVFAVNISIFIGYKLKKFPGALALALGAILPSFFIILGIALFFQRFKEYEAEEKAGQI